MNLKTDTGTEVTVIIEQAWKAIGQPALSPVRQNLRWPDFHILSAMERFTGTVKFRKQGLMEVIYMVKELTKPPLGCPTIEQLHLIQHIAAVAKELTPMEEFPFALPRLQNDRGRSYHPA